MPREPRKVAEVSVGDSVPRQPPTRVVVEKRETKTEWVLIFDDATEERFVKTADPAIEVEVTAPAPTPAPSTAPTGR